MVNTYIIKTKKPTCDDFVKMAQAYFDTAKLLFDHHINEIQNNTLPFYYLLSHSLELYLKGYLCKKSIKIEKTHDLVSLYKLCEGLCLTPIEIEYINIFNQYNADSYYLRYPTLEESILPHPNISIALLQHISQAVNKIDK